MTGTVYKIAVLGLGMGLSASAWAQRPPQGPTKPGASPEVMNAPKPSAAQPQTPVQPPMQAQPQTPCTPPTCTPPAVVYPPRPEQMAPVAPEVTYRNGQLSIVAQNSTLSSILLGVRARTGAKVEMPPDAANDRVAAQLGPGNPRDVLASLLEGSRFDYIVLGSATDPNAVSQVILTPHAGSAGAPPAIAGANQPPMRGGNGSAEEDENAPPGPPIRGGAGRPEMPADEDEPAVPETMPQPQPQGEIVQPQPGMPAPQSGEGQTNPNQVKTPEQLLQELQRMQQQQQQQQQQQGGGQQPMRGRQQPPQQ